MDERTAFFAAIAAEPRADLPRLAYADWLDDRNDKASSHHAGFIRRQIAGVCTVPPLSLLMGLEPVLGVLAHQVAKNGDKAGARVWSQPGNPELIFRGGFVSELRCSLDRLMSHAPGLFAREPAITRVVLTDRDPHRTVWLGGDWVWSWRRAERPALPHDLPESIFDGLPGKSYRTPEQLRVFGRTTDYPAADAARDALSHAAVNYGRSVAAGLTHEVECGRCDGVGTIVLRAAGVRSGGRAECPECHGSGRVIRPGLAPLEMTCV